MNNRHRQKIIAFISAIAIFAMLTVKIANLPSLSIYSLWQYDWAKSYQQVISWFGNKEEFKQVEESSEGQTTSAKGDRFNHLNEQKQIEKSRTIISSQHDSIKRVNTEYGYAIAIQNGLEGVVDLEGKILLPFEYEKIYQPPGSEFLVAKKNDKRDIYSLTKKEVILTGLDRVPFPEGRYYFITAKNGKQGVVDTKGRINIPFEYDRVAPFSLQLDSVIFKNDEQDESAIIPTFRNGKQGVDDVDSNRVTIPPKFDRIDYINFQDNYGIVVKDDQTGIYDPRTDSFTPLKYDRLELLSDEQYVRLVFDLERKNITKVKSNAAFLLNEDNQTRLLLNNFYAYHLDYVIAMRNGKQGILNIDNGEVVIPFEYENIQAYSNNSNYVIVNKAGKRGILNIDNGEAVIPFEYDDIQADSNNLDYAIATKAGKSGVLNLQDSSFTAINGDQLNNSLLDLGYVIFSQNGKEGIANLTGETIIPAQFDLNDDDDDIDPVSIRLMDENYLIATQKDRQGILNLQTKKFLALDYDEINNGRNIDIEPGYLVAIKDEKSGIIDLQGNIVVPLADKQIEGFLKGVVWRRDYDDIAPQIASSQPNQTEQGDLFINDIAILSVKNRYNISCVVNRQGKILIHAQVYHNWGVEKKVDNICRSLTGTKVNNDLITENSLAVEPLYGAKYGADFAPGSGEYVSLIDDGLIKIHVNNKWGYANAQGNVVVYPQFDALEAK